MGNNIQKKSVFNTVFKTPFLADSKKKRVIYSSILYSVTALLFIFLVIALVVSNSWTTTINSAFSKADSDKIDAIFGKQDNYVDWSNSVLLNYNDTIVIGGAVNMAIAFGKQQIVTATTVLSFISVAMIIVALCFKKNTIASFVLLSFEFCLLVTVMALFITLVVAGGKDFEEYKKHLDSIDKIISESKDDLKVNVLKALENIKAFLTK